ncbi:CbiX/SirB N-terminal domain-containing protein [Parasedimentitalea psychrophila]|uniref:CbiX/SirB N-terminal domain-containing protein n=1 Tax=Parasedimentitalea psychrophila TaxID=2997337 RepID=A0A9Y2KXG5_9RHOB|nr:CbiX/SirB N-terminal domain-containing protein [Parasedimentitalea psychrophila]WIY23811.1 CbiX/SirB N-terminal domain-containing protein [Parasedimentitalea psychrophila]
MPDRRPIALITAHGQPSNPQPPEAALARLAAQLQDLLPEWHIRSATLSAPGRFEGELTPGAVIYPFFMARGWFAGQVLSRRIGQIPHQMACPFGLDPALPALVASALENEVAKRGWTGQDYELLLAAHGSARGPKAAEAAEDFATALRPLLPQSRITTGFVEQAPLIETAAQALRDRALRDRALSDRALSDRALCLPFFAQAGDHSRIDIPQSLTAAGFTDAPLPVTGALPGVAHLIARALETCLGAGGAR